MSALVYAKRQDEIMKNNSYAICNCSNYSVDLKTAIKSTVVLTSLQKYTQCKYASFKHTLVYKVYSNFSIN